MPAFKFLGIPTGAAVALSVAQGALTESAAVPAWGEIISGSVALSLSANRVTGTAPMGVLLTATASSDEPRVESPFHDIEGLWRFDDPGQYTALGNNPLWGTDRNLAYGPETVHVFSEPGVYEVTYQATDGAGFATDTITITVENPDSIFAGQDTAVVSSSGNFSGAPSGASQHSSISSALAALSSRTNRRILLRAGETFNDGISFQAFGGANRRFCVGRFGSGDNPKINRGTLSFRGDPSNVIEAIVDRVDIEHDFDPTNPFNSPFGGPKGIDFAGGGQSILNAHKTVWGCNLTKIEDIAIEVDGVGDGAGEQAINFYCGNTLINDWWNYAFLSGDGGRFGFCGCRFVFSPGTVNGRNQPKFSEATALHSTFRLSRPMGQLVFSNVDFNSFVNWSSSSTSRSFQPHIRWNTNSPNQKLVVDRMRCEGGVMSIQNNTPQASINDNWVLLDRVHHVHSDHAASAIEAPMGGTTIRNYVCVIPNNAPANSTGLRTMFTDSSSISVTSGEQTRRSEFYSNALVDLRSDANARSRTGNQDRDFDPGDFDNIANSFFGNNILHAPNMSTGGTTGHGPLNTTATYTVHGGEGERWETLTPNLAMAYGNEVTALFRPETGSSAIGGANGKISLYDFDGNLRSDVLATLSRPTPSVGPFEPSEED